MAHDRKAAVEEREILESLATRLWEEREVVAYLLFKLTVTKLMLAADDRRFVPDVVAEIDQTMATLREHEGRREQAIERLADAWLVDASEVTLEALATRSPEPFDAIFDDHRDAFVALASEIEATGRDNRALARARLNEVASSIGMLAGHDGDDGTTYDATGGVGESRRAATQRLRRVL